MTEYFFYYYCARAREESLQIVPQGKQPKLEQINYAAATVEDCEQIMGGCPEDCPFKILRIEAPDNS